MTGSGKKDDPVRPEYAPTAADSARLGIVSWSMQPTDDRNMALLHLVAVNHHAFDALLADKRSEIRVFEIGRKSQAAIETELQKYRKDFTLEKFRVIAR